ncbi:MAG: TIGR04438 family Trp-rich protein [Sutterellaceae bacterium]|nr:TIGR04438 family Trp-rich protein [Burkholderiaceae bacterium]MCX7901952.1 TIGR04438 family Trp-rich protein [Burkholderiaceae bacterium]MDW8430188.1 TIGR04438 family Trp-rich protein [Sutterellaceae bacterium]
MWLLWIAVALLLLKALGLGPFADLSWWWVAASFGAAFFWFEVVERRLGLDKKKAFDELERAKQERIKRTLQEARRPRR